jgi:hypothetical protein
LLAHLGKKPKGDAFGFSLYLKWPEIFSFSFAPAAGLPRLPAGIRRCYPALTSGLLK